MQICAQYYIISVSSVSVIHVLSFNCIHVIQSTEAYLFFFAMMFYIIGSDAGAPGCTQQPGLLATDLVVSPHSSRIKLLYHFIILVFSLFQQSKLVGDFSYQLHIQTDIGFHTRLSDSIQFYKLLLQLVFFFSILGFEPNGISAYFSIFIIVLLLNTHSRYQSWASLWSLGVVRTVWRLGCRLGALQT